MDIPEHPAAKAAFYRALHLRQEAEKQKRSLKQLMAACNLRSVHIRLYSDGKVNPKGGLTAVWRPTRLSQHHKNHVIQVSTAVCSPCDSYVPWMGEYLAATNFANGQWIMLRCEKGEEAHMIRRAFRVFVPQRESKYAL